MGYESFLVNTSLLCMRQFCVVMSEYLTVFHHNIVKLRGYLVDLIQGKRFQLK